jgi:TonB-linked SusC/RagA family outer membrane protein
MNRSKVRKVRTNLPGTQSVLLATALFVAGLVAAVPAAAQTGTVTGRVLSATSGEPLHTAQVSIEGTGIGQSARANGRFLLLDVPAGTHTITAVLIGFGTASAEITVVAGETAEVELRLESEAIMLSEIVVTGVAGATQQTKLPFSVGKVSVADLPVPSQNAGHALSGKLAGVTVHQGSGRPGSAPSILLRGPTSLNASGRDQEPLYIVDGVILGSSLVDLDALDIESIEVVKGAAAASLYGSRAGNGVIQIRTKRGQTVAGNQIRYTVRSEYGQSGLASTPDNLLTESHEYLLDGDLFVTTGGDTCEWVLCDGPPALAGNAPWRNPDDGANEWNTTQDVAWPGQTFDQINEVMETGDYLNNSVTAEGRAGETNFMVSLSNLKERGVLPFQEGFRRTNLRVNVDQQIKEQLQVQASAFYSKSTQDDFPEGAGNPMFQLTRMPAGVDLRSEDPFVEGDIILNVDIANQEQPNPLYELQNRSRVDDRGRFLGSLNVRYSPFDFLDVDANGSFDRLDRDDRNVRPKGYRTINPSGTVNNGDMSLINRVRESANASMTATLRGDLADGVRNTTQFRYLYEDQFIQNNDVAGNTFAASGVERIDNLDSETINGGSSEQTVRSDGYFAISSFDIFDKYIVDALIRNDGSSLFGEDERRQWYYRVAGAWRLSEEPFFNIPGIEEFKLRYSLGTAGGRPRFEAQYETYSVAGGRVTPVTLGNRDLKPEFTTEHEAGIDASLFNNRASLALTYAKGTTEDQIQQVPLASFAGFTSQWQNAGTVESTSYEATLDVSLVESQDFGWTAKLLFDRTKSTITELNLPDFQYGVAGQGLGNVFFAREGEEVGTFYGRMAAQSCADLPTDVSCDGFAVNDDGWLVWVGDGGLQSQAWGTDSDVTVRGAPVKWGTPFIGECDDGAERVTNCPLGNTIPDFSLNFSQNFSYKGLNLFALLSHVNGFDVYNQPVQWATFANYSGIMEQAGVPDAQKKPIGYYKSGLYQALGGLNPSSPFIEDATFTKLREVSLSYTFGADQLAGIPGLQRVSGLGISVSGRNLYTWTDYTGFDPEVGKSGGDTGSSAIARVEGYQYPNFRTWTAALQLLF